MDYFSACKIKDDYINEIAKEESFHSLRLLGHTLDEVITAFKVTYIHMVKYHTYDQKFFDQEMLILKYINLFVDHENYAKWNAIAERTLDKSQICNEDILALSRKEGQIFTEFDNYTAYDEVMDFVQAIQKNDRNDPLFFQKAYTIAGLEYRPEYKEIMERAERDFHSFEDLERARDLIHKKKEAQKNKDVIKNHPKDHVIEQVVPEVQKEQINKNKRESTITFDQIKTVLYITLIIIVFVLYIQSN